MEYLYRILLIVQLMVPVSTQGNCYVCTIFNKDFCCNKSGLGRCCDSSTRNNLSCPNSVSVNLPQCKQYRCLFDGQCPSGYKCCPPAGRICMPSSLMVSNISVSTSAPTSTSTIQPSTTNESTISSVSTAANTTETKTSSGSSSGESSSSQPQSAAESVQIQTRKESMEKLEDDISSNKRVIRQATPSPSSSTNPPTGPQSSDLQCPITIVISATTGLTTCGNQQGCSEGTTCCPLPTAANMGCCFPMQ